MQKLQKSMSFFSLCFQVLMLLVSKNFVKVFHISHILLQFAAMFYAEVVGFSELQHEEGSFEVEV